MALIMFVGCNSIDSKKGKPSNNNKKVSKLTQTINEGTILSNKDHIKELAPKTDKRILNLLKKAKILDVPLIFSFEKQFDISSIEKIIPLSDDVLDLLHIDRIKRFNEDNYSKIVWKCSQIELSERYRTLVFAIYDESIGQHVLINYTNNFELIDFEFITYEDYIEGYSSTKSLIKKGEIIRYYSGYEQPNDTTIFKINENGHINVVEKELRRVKKNN